MEKQLNSIIQKYQSGELSTIQALNQISMITHPDINKFKIKPSLKAKKSKKSRINRTIYSRER